MKFKELLKTTEGLVVIIGSLLGIFSGKFWIIATLIVYILLNVPNYWSWIKNKLQGWF